MVNSNFVVAGLAGAALAAAAAAALFLVTASGPHYQGVGIGNNNLQIFVVDTARGAVKSCTIGNPQQGVPPRCTPWSGE